MGFTFRFEKAEALYPHRVCFQKYMFPNAAIPEFRRIRISEFPNTHEVGFWNESYANGKYNEED